MIRSLEIGKRSLIANQRGLEVTANNISNINTPGYSRQALLLKPAESIPIDHLRIGMGVLGDHIRQFRDHLLDRTVQVYTSTQSYYQQDTTIFQRIEAILGEPGDTTIQTAFQAFFDAANSLASNPSNLAHRRLFVDRAIDVAQLFNRIGYGIEDLRNNLYVQAQSTVDRVNNVLSSLATLNQQITATLDNSRQPAPLLIDEQNHLLEELSKYLDINVVRDSTGRIMVSSGGMMLVSLATALQIRMQKNPTSTAGETLIKFTMHREDNTPLGVINPQSGQLASLVNHYNVTLNSLTSSSEFSVARELDTLARQFALRINSIAAAGYGLNDNGPIPPARTIFLQPIVGSITAINITVNPTLRENPEDVPTASVPNSPGNNDVIRAIASLATDGTFLNSTTPEGYYGTIISRLASLDAAANNDLAVTRVTLKQATNQREALSGVNLDEEATNLITYQRAFEAAARVVAITSEMLAQLVKLGQ